MKAFKKLRQQIRDEAGNLKSQSLIHVYHKGEIGFNPAEAKFVRLDKVFEKLDGLAEKLEPMIEELTLATPTTEKIEVYDSETKETWIVKTANPDQWQSFYETLDMFIVKIKQLLESLK